MRAEEMTLERLEQIARSTLARSPGRAMVVGKPREDDVRGGMGLFEASMRPALSEAIAKITGVVERTYGDTGQVKIIVSWIDQNGKKGTTDGDPKNDHTKALVARAKREGVKVKKESWGAREEERLNEARDSADNIKLMIRSELLGRGWVALTDLARAKDFRGIHFAKIETAASALKSDGKIETKQDGREGLMVKLKAAKTKDESALDRRSLDALLTNG